MTILRRLGWLTAPLIFVGFLVAWKTLCRAVRRLALHHPAAAPSRSGAPSSSCSRASTTGMHAGITLYETVVGFAFALLFGVSLGAILGKVAWLERALMPFVVALQVVPKGRAGAAVHPVVRLRPRLQGDRRRRAGLLPDLHQHAAGREVGSIAAIATSWTA